MVHSDNSEKRENQSGESEITVNVASSDAQCEIVGDGGRSGDDSGTGKRRRNRKPSFEEPDLTIVDEHGNEFRISVNKTPYRYYRLELFVNGHSIIPMTFPGTQPMRSYWDMLKATFKGVKTSG